METLPDARLQWIEECGHVPHLEQPKETAAAISNFLASELTGNRVITSRAIPEVDVAQPPLIGAGFVGAIVLAEALKYFSQ